MSAEHETAPDGAAGSALVTVRILRLPLALHRRASEHSDALQRELALIDVGGAEQASVPTRLLALVSDVRGRYSGFTAKTQLALEAARERGEEAVDLVYELPPSAALACAELDALLDEAEGYCAARDHLITTSGATDTVEYRRWFLGQFVAQIDGAAPVTWPAWRRERGLDALAGDGGAQASPADGSGSEGPAAGSGREGGARRVTAVTLSGEIDLEQAPALRQRFVDLLGQGFTTFEVDGSGVDFIDSVGLSVLLATYARCQEVGGTLRVIRPSRRLRSTMETAGVAERLLG